jgi:uncharacterized NAD(P)/FAD-binding protein YdhS
MPSCVAIVGCGFTGTSALYQLVTEYTHSNLKKILLFEKSGCFGPGYAYKLTERQDYLINNTTDTMGIVPTHRTAFYEWIVENHSEMAPGESKELKLIIINFLNSFS